jgi:hypothetical protein
MPRYYSYITDNPGQDTATGLSDAIKNCRPCPTIEDNHFDGWCPGGRPATNQTGSTGFAVVHPGEDFWIDEDWAKTYALQSFTGEGNLRNHTCDVSTVPHCLGHNWRKNKRWHNSLQEVVSMTNNSASAKLSGGQTLAPECEDDPYNMLPGTCATVLHMGCGTDLHTLNPALPEGSLISVVCPVSCDACVRMSVRSMGQLSASGTTNVRSTVEGIKCDSKGIKCECRNGSYTVTAPYFCKHTDSY